MHRVLGVFVSVTLCLAATDRAHGHFLFIALVESPKGDRAAEVYFSDKAGAGDPQFVDKIAGTKLWLQDQPGRFQPIKTHKHKDRLSAVVPDKGNFAVVGSCEYGVLSHKTTFLLRHFPKTLAGAPEQWHEHKPFPTVPLEILGRLENGKLRLTVLRQGQPMPQAEIYTLAKDLSGTKQMCDATGSLTWQPPKAGWYMVYTSDFKKESGKHQGKDYEEIRDFASMSFEWQKGEPAAADVTKDWPQFLGPNRDGIIPDKGLNLDWKAKAPPTLWKVPIGSGFSSVIVVGDKIYTQAKRGPKDGVLCLDAKDGKEQWFYEAAPSYIDKQKQGPGPRSTPTYHQGKLYCLFPMGELLCLTTDGKKVWEADMFKDTGAKNQVGQFYYWGVSTSPLVEGDLVIVQPGGTNNNSVAAYHKDTGKLAWSAGSDPICYASPIAITVAGKKQLIVPTGQSVLGLEPTKGQVLWRYAFGNPFNATCATPVWADNLLYVSAAYGAGSAVLEIVPPDKDKKDWTVREKWKNKKVMQNLMATSMVSNGLVYGCSGDLSAFFLRCLDLPTGTVKWEERVEGRYGLLAVEGHLLCMSERGDLLLVKAQPQSYAVKAELPKLLTFKTWAAPAYAGGKLYLRDDHDLLCLDLRK